MEKHGRRQKLDNSLGVYSWRRWRYEWKATSRSAFISCKEATNVLGETQPAHHWNPQRIHAQWNWKINSGGEVRWWKYYFPLVLVCDSHESWYFLFRSWSKYAGTNYFRSTCTTEWGRLSSPGSDGYDLFLSNCGICHSYRYIQMQPAFQQENMEKTVDKMIKTFGAPIPDSSVVPIVDYLMAACGKKDWKSSSCLFTLHPSPFCLTWNASSHSSRPQRSIWSTW